MLPETLAFDELVARYQGVLLDAYGVLVDARGPLRGAHRALAHLEAAGIPHLVVTNDASRLPATWASRLAGYGIDVGEHRVLTSGSLIAAHFAARGLAGARCLVLGPADSRRYVEEAGGEVVPASLDADYDALIVADDEGYDFLPTIELAISVAFRHIERGQPLALVLPNPDVIYPRGLGAFGLTSGAVAALIELALDRRFPDRALRFDRLGKPHRLVFDEAVRRLGTTRLVMIGDQLETDIAGALGAGLDAALVTTGVAQLGDAALVPRPTYLLRDLDATNARTA
jgi:HAD superfamily hydrolase (TIGR01450 family)